MDPRLRRLRGRLGRYGAARVRITSLRAANWARPPSFTVSGRRRGAEVKRDEPAGRIRVRLTARQEGAQTPDTQVHGPGAVQWFGTGWREETAATMGDRKPAIAATMSVNEAGT